MFNLDGINSDNDRKFDSWTQKLVKDLNDFWNEFEE